MIRWFDSKLAAAMPVITNTQGDLLKMLTSLLVTGVNDKPITLVSYADGVCTLTVGAAHGFLNYSVIDIQNSTQPEFVGKRFRLSEVSDTTISFEVPNAVNAEVGLTVRYAPLGWTQHFASTGKACFKSPDPRYPAYLRIDDTKMASMSAANAKFARVEICDGMTDFNTATWQSPYDPIIPTKNRTETDNSKGWFKWYYSAARNLNPDTAAVGNSNHNYILVGDETYFWLIINPYQESSVDNKYSAAFGLVLTDNGLEFKQALVAVDGSGPGGSNDYPESSFIVNSSKLNVATFYGDLSSTLFLFVTNSINSETGATKYVSTSDVSDAGLLLRFPSYTVAGGSIKSEFKGLSVCNKLNNGDIIKLGSKIYKTASLNPSTHLVLDLE